MGLEARAEVSASHVHTDFCDPLSNYPTEAKTTKTFKQNSSSGRAFEFLTQIRPCVKNNVIY